MWRTGAMITNFRPSFESSSELRVISLVLLLRNLRIHINPRIYSRNDRLFSRRNADDSDSEADTREMDSRMSIRNIDRCESAVVVTFTFIHKIKFRYSVATSENNNRDPFCLYSFCSSESKGRANSTLPRIERDRYSGGGGGSRRSSSRKSRSASPRDDRSYKRGSVRRRSKSQSHNHRRRRNESRDSHYDRHSRSSRSESRGVSRRIRRHSLPPSASPSPSPSRRRRTRGRSSSFHDPPTRFPPIANGRDRDPLPRWRN